MSCPRPRAAPAALLLVPLLTACVTDPDTVELRLVPLTEPANDPT